MIRKSIDYLGIENPTTTKEVEVEICGLKHAVKVAEELISRLDQALAIMELKKSEMLDESQEK